MRLKVVGQVAHKKRERTRQQASELKEMQKFLLIKVNQGKYNLFSEMSQTEMSQTFHKHWKNLKTYASQTKEYHKQPLAHNQGQPHKRQKHPLSIFWDFPLHKGNGGTGLQHSWNCSQEGRHWGEIMSNTRDRIFQQQITFLFPNWIRGWNCASV